MMDRLRPYIQPEPVRVATHAICFAAYLASSIAMIYLLGQKSSPEKRPGCYVQQTYRQEFMANVASNPFYSSTSIFRSGPLSGLETNYFNATDRAQMTADISMFPNMIYDPLSNGAFIPISVKPKDENVTGFLIPARKMENGTFYYDESTESLRFQNIPIPFEIQIPLLLNMIKSVKGGRVKPGMHFPNLGRLCPIPCFVHLRSIMSHAIFRCKVPHCV